MSLHTLLTKHQIVHGLENDQANIDAFVKELTEVMEVVVPGVNRIGYSGMCKTCEKPCDLDTCVCDGRNEAISEIKSAIKLMGEK